MSDYEKLYHGLDRAAWAYFFLYFNINVGGVSLLPTFVGYLLFLGAIKLLEDEERELSLIRPLAVLLAIWHSLDWFLSFIGADLYGLQFIDLIRNVINIYFHFQLLTNLASIAQRYQPEGMELDHKLLRYRTLQTLMITALWAITYFSDWFGDYWSLISGGMGVVYVIAGICLMKALFDLRRNLATE